MPQDLLKDATSLLRWKQDFTLSSTYWRRFASRAALTWQRVRFVAAKRLQVPQRRGVYAFVVVHDNPSFPPHGYILYIGETGGASKRTLRARYADYLDEQQVVKRAAVHFMLNRWRRDLFFFFSVINDNRLSLTKLERALNDALVPPYNIQDFSATVRSAVKAFRHA